MLAPLPPSLAGQALAFLCFVRNVGNVLGLTIGEPHLSFSAEAMLTRCTGSTALANTLAKKLPSEFIAQLPRGVASAYSAIPSISAL